MTTLKDISQKTGYSITTISRALNGYSDIGTDTIKKVRDVALEMGYIANASARSLKTRKSWTIGVIFDEHSGIGLRHPLFANVLEEFKKAVEYEGYDVLFITRQKGKKPTTSFYNHAIEKSVDGVFVLCTDYQSSEYQELAKSNIPTVVLDHLSNNIYNIASDNRSSIADVINHLKDLGHTKIAHIFGDPLNFAGLKRREHFISSMLLQDLDVRSDFLVEGTTYTTEEGYAAMKVLLSIEDKPTAVFCAGDMLAIGAIRAIEDAGLKCPDDVSVVGFDGIDLGDYITPKLTTVKQKTKSMGRTSADYLINIIDGVIKNVAKTVYIDTELVIKESTKLLNTISVKYK